MTLESILAQLHALANPVNVAGMARFGINPQGTLGISIPNLRRIARAHRNDHTLALQLWETGIHEARILAAFVDDPAQVTAEQMDAWAVGFDSWDVCDQVCISLFDRTMLAVEKVHAWVKRPEEFVKRAGFTLIAGLAWHRKELSDELFVSFLPLIRSGAEDERNFVKKAVNWALRHIGKRNRRLTPAAVALAQELAQSSSRAARWVGKDALNELTSEKTLSRIP